jgi:hypothetical protein
VNEATAPATWSSKGPTSAPSSTSFALSAAATICPVSASRPICSLPRPARFGAVLFDQPLTRAKELQAHAVHQQV